MLKEICKRAHETKNETLVEDLYQELHNLQNITSKIIESDLNSYDKKNWLEIITNYMDGIQQRDKVLLLDCLEYALIPYLEKIGLIDKEMEK